MMTFRPGGSRVYGEPAEVRARDDGRPLRFVWRSRLYVVHVICEHWVISREWWREPATEPGQPELEYWRVEASPGRGVPARMYELRRDPRAGAWTIRPDLAARAQPARAQPARAQLAVPRRCST